MLDSAQAAGETLGNHLLVKHLIQIPQCSRPLPTSNILKALIISPAVWAGSASTTNVLEDKCTARTSVYKPIAWSRWTQLKAEQWGCPVPSLHSKSTHSKTLNLLKFARTNQSNEQLHLWIVFPKAKVIFLLYFKNLWAMWFHYWLSSLRRTETHLLSYLWQYLLNFTLFTW